MLFSLAAPSTAFIALAREIVAALYQTGRFTADATAVVSSVLAAYGVGLWGQATVNLFASAFYAMRDTRTPVKIAALSLVVSTGLAWVLMRWLGAPGIALGSSIGAFLNTTLHLRDLSRRIGSVLRGPDWRAVGGSPWAGVPARGAPRLGGPGAPQARLLENNLIREHKPRFNIRLTDDKSYPRIAVTLGEPFPRVLVVRRVAMAGARFFGPYTDVATLRQTLRIIRRIFTVRSCHWDLPGDAPARPCLDYHIDRKSVV